MTDIGFLIGDVARLLRRRFDERARLIGVTRQQWRLLVMLNRCEGLNQGALAERLEVEPISLCRMVDRLEEAGHVERRRDPADRRAWRLFLTDRSRPLIEQLARIADAVMEQALTGISAEAHAALAAVLTDVRANLATPFVQDAAHG
ncbi:MarR family winged helix-turn-helix transcriptional regulator [Sphingomonas bacterium]|uniref:MarR family winged helix-turn-helix transcriptional regulator n=1 Tax=Sphingomonas bacterium TaxID=1895847 RepID=UPI00157721B9|nr:MarR family transcriptional regulator [Sphingomonas bacterium]